MIPRDYECCNSFNRVVLIVSGNNPHHARLVAEHKEFGTPVLEVNEIDAPLPVTVLYADPYTYLWSRATGRFAYGSEALFVPGPVWVVIDARQDSAPLRGNVAAIARELRCHAAVALTPVTRSTQDPDRAGPASVAHGHDVRVGYWQVEESDRLTVSADLRGEGERLVLSPRWDWEDPE